MRSSTLLGNLLGTWAVCILVYALMVGFMFFGAVWAGYFSTLFVQSPHAAIRIIQNEYSRPHEPGVVAALGDTEGDRVEGILLMVTLPVILIS